MKLDLRLDLIVNSHGHTDHTAEDDILRKLTGAKIAIHELDAYRLASEDEASEQLHIQKKPIEPDIQLVNGGEVTIGPNTILKIIHTPGHTEGSICLYEEKLGILFSGDTLFAGGYGRLDGMGADSEAMASSLKRIMALPGLPMFIRGMAVLRRSSQNPGSMRQLARIISDLRNVFLNGDKKVIIFYLTNSGASNCRARSSIVKRPIGFGKTTRRIW